MPRIFISYSRKDHDAALPIMNAISSAGLNIWPPTELPPGENFSEAIADAIESAQCIVLLWSKAAAESEFVQQEMHRAIKAWSSDRLVLAALDDAPLPVGLRDLSPIPIRYPNDSGTKQVIERAQTIVGRESTTAAAPGPARPDATIPARPTWHSRRSWHVATVGGIAALILAGLAILNRSFHQPEVIHAPVGNGLGLMIPLALLILIVLMVGAVMGAGIIWIWSKRSRARSGRASPSRQTPEASHGAQQIFVSYSHLDERPVEHVVEQMGQLGLRIWIDRQSKGSDRYAAPIVRAIRQSRLVALMCSQNAFASDHVIREVYVAGDYKKPFVLFQLDPAEIPDEILYFVSPFPRVPVADMNPQRLHSEIARLLAA